MCGLRGLPESTVARAASERIEAEARASQSQMWQSQHSAGHQSWGVMKVERPVTETATRVTFNLHIAASQLGGFETEAASVISTAQVSRGMEEKSCAHQPP